MATEYVIDMLRRKAITSPCVHKVAAVALSKKGNVLGSVTNSYRYIQYGGGLHAERELIRKYGRAIFQIIIARVNKGGNFLPIDPCANCKKIADRYGIRILSIK